MTSSVSSLEQGRNIFVQDREAQSASDGRFGIFVELLDGLLENRPARDDARGPGREEPAWAVVTAERTEGGGEWEATERAGRPGQETAAADYADSTRGFAAPAQEKPEGADAKDSRGPERDAAGGAEKAGQASSAPEDGRARAEAKEQEEKPAGEDAGEQEEPASGEEPVAEIAEEAAGEEAAGEETGEVEVVRDAGEWEVEELPEAEAAESSEEIAVAAALEEGGDEEEELSLAEDPEAEAEMSPDGVVPEAAADGASREQGDASPEDGRAAAASAHTSDGGEVSPGGKEDTDFAAMLEKMESTGDATGKLGAPGRNAAAMASDPAAGLLSRVEHIQNLVERFDLHVLSMVKSATDSMTITIMPEQMGKLVVNCSQEADGVRVSVQAENATVCNLLQEQVAGIRQVMENNGFKLAGFQVSEESGGHAGEQKGRQAQGREDEDEQQAKQQERGPGGSSPGTQPRAEPSLSRGNVRLVA